MQEGTSPDRWRNSVNVSHPCCRVEKSSEEAGYHVWFVAVRKGPLEEGMVRMGLEGWGAPSRERGGHSMGNLGAGVYIYIYIHTHTYTHTHTHTHSF